jgi:hypothetical protein
VKLSLSKALTLLVATGRGQECNEMIHDLHNTLLAIDPETQLSKTWIFKYGAKEHLAAFYRISNETALVCFPRLGLPVNNDADRVWQ